MATAKDVMKMVTDNEVLFVDFRFTDTRGKEQHVSVPAKAFDEDKFEHGHAFDGSSIGGGGAVVPPPSQAVSQQTPSTHEPLTHSISFRHVSPLFLGSTSSRPNTYTAPFASS